jgi:hypothetical protein
MILAAAVGVTNLTVFRPEPPTRLADGNPRRQESNIVSLTKILSCLAVAMTLLLAGAAQGTPFLVTIDTSSVVGSEATMFFDLNHTGVTSAQVQISGFATDGSLVGGTDGVDPAGADVTGTLPGDVSISNAGFAGTTPITYFQNIVLATSISFMFDMVAGSSDPLNPDGFALTLLDASTGAPLMSDVGPLFLFSAGQGCDANFSTAVTCEAAAGAPEPATLALVLAALVGLASLRTRRLRI